jgi:hypothetical protein
MNFNEWVSLRMNGEKISESAVAPMSKSGFSSGKIPHGEYKSPNFDRYIFKPSEEKVASYADKLSRALKNDVLVGVEALAGYYGNDGIVRVFDDFLKGLENEGIKL